jgi:large subunit ribosomal protein L35
MPKLKTHRGAKKRFRLKANGTVKRRGANRNHILTKHTTKKKRDARIEATSLKPCDARLAKRMIQGS